MTNTEIFIDGKRLDLPTGVVVSLTKQINDVAEIQKRNVDFTNRFSVPKTANNLEIFKNLNLVGNTSEAPYKFVKVEVVVNGITVSGNGVATVTETKNRQAFELFVYAGNYDLFSRTNGKYITDLDWTDLVHTFNDTQLGLQLSRTENFIYPIADTLNGRMNIRNNDATDIDAEYQVPHVFVKTIWQRIFAEAGLQYYGAFFDSFEFNNELVPADNYDFNSRRKYYCSFVKDTVSYVSTGGLLNTTPQTLDVNLPFTVKDDPQLMQLSATEVKIKQRGMYRIVFTAKELMTLISENVTVTLYRNTEALQIIDIGTHEQNPGYRVELLIEQRVFCEINDILTIALHVETKTKTGFTYENFQVDISEMDWIINYDSKILFNEVIDFSLCLPKIQQKDFLTAIMQQYGLVYQVRSDGRYEFIRIEDLLNGVAGFDDKTNLLDSESSEKYSIGAYKKQSKFSYKYIDRDKLGEGYADDAISIDIDTLDESGDIIASNIQASGDVLDVGNAGTVASINSYFTASSNTEAEYELQANATLKTVMLKRVLVNPNVSIRYTFADGGFTNVFWTSAAGYPFVTFNSLSWKQLVPAHYPKFVKMIQTPLKKNVKVWLTPIDIYTLNMFRLWYFEQYQSFFYLNKINSFVAGKLTDCETIKIN